MDTFVLKEYKNAMLLEEKRRHFACGEIEAATKLRRILAALGNAEAMYELGLSYAFKSIDYDNKSIDFETIKRALYWLMESHILGGANWDECAGILYRMASKEYLGIDYRYQYCKTELSFLDERNRHDVNYRVIEEEEKIKLKEAISELKTFLPPSMNEEDIRKIEEAIEERLNITLTPQNSAGHGSK